MSVGVIAIHQARVTYVAAHASAGLNEIGSPESFDAHLRSPGVVAGLTVGLPFELYTDGTPDTETTEWNFWSSVCERSLEPPTTPAAAQQVRRAGLPLRARLAVQAHLSGPLSAPPRIEVLLHPFGCVVLVTADLTWPGGTDPVDANSDLAELEKVVAQTDVAGVTVSAGIKGLAAAVADQLINRLGATPVVRIPVRRLVSVIDGEVDTGGATGFVAPPTQASQLHRDLHVLAGGTSTLERIERAVVPRWTGGSFDWPSNELVYVLDRGAAALLVEAVNQRPRRNVVSENGDDAHRNSPGSLTEIPHLVAGSRLAGGWSHSASGVGGAGLVVA